MCTGVGNNQEVRFSVGRNKFDNRPEQKCSASFGGFENFALKTNERSAEKGGRYICAPLKKGPHKTQPDKYPGESFFRCKDYAEEVNVLVFDLDGVTTSREDYDQLPIFLEDMGFRGFTYETSSSTPESPRGRVIISADRYMSADVRSRASIEIEKMIRKEFGSDAFKFDPSIYQPWQPIYLPTRDAPSVRFGIENNAGANVDKLIENTSRRGAIVDTKRHGTICDVTRELMNGSPFAPWSLDEIRAECPTIDYIASVKGDVSEPLWRSFLGIVKHTTGGANLCHELSKGHPEYNHEETQKKIDGWTAGPTLCTTFRIDPDSKCTNCANTCNSPINLGQKAKVAATESYADVRNANELQSLYQGDLLYLRHKGHWIIWKENKWRPCEKGEEMRYAVSVLQKQVAHAKQLMTQDPDRAKTNLSHAISSQKLPRLKAMLELAATLPRMSATASELDSDIYLLGVGNGIVDLKSGKLMPNTPSLLVTRYCNADYVEDAKCPLWIRFLQDVFCEDDETVESVQRILGYTLTGSNTEEVLIICCGYGSNGKSVFQNVISSIMGDYAKNAPSTLLKARRSDDTGPRNDLAGLAGARYASINEMQAGDRLDEQTIKQLAGREDIAARYLYKEFFSYRPQFTPFLRTNHKPIVTGVDDGIWRRLLMLPFKRQFVGQDKDSQLEEKLMSERDGILRWMVQGAVKWHKEELNLSQTIQNESRQYRSDSDVLAEFLSEECEFLPNERTTQRVLWERWRNWCTDSGVRHGSKKSFTRRLAERGHEIAKSNGKRYYKGVKCNSITFLH